MKNDCIFCAIVAGEIPSEKLYEDEHVIIIRDIAPQAKEHFLMIPKVHAANWSELTDAQASVIGSCMRAYDAFARKQGLTNGYRMIINCGADGKQTVPHLHIHLLGGEPLSEKMS